MYSATTYPPQLFLHLFWYPVYTDRASNSLTFRRIEVYQYNVPAILFWDLDLCLPLSQAPLICAMRFVLYKCQGQEVLPGRGTWAVMGAVESTSPVAPLLLFCTTSGDMLGLLIWFLYLQPPVLSSFFFFLFYVLEAQGETGERAVKCDGKMLISGISKKLFEEETHC